MSYLEIPARDRRFSVAVGWNTPMRSFFATVIDRTAAKDGEVVVWIGRSVGEIETADGLSAPLAPYCDLSSETMTLLRADRAAAIETWLRPLQMSGASFGRGH